MVSKLAISYKIFLDTTQAEIITEDHLHIIVPVIVIVLEISNAATHTVNNNVPILTILVELE